MRIHVRLRPGAPARGLLLVLGILLSACARGEPEPDPPASFAAELGVDISEMDRSDSGLYIQVLVEGRGEPAAQQQRITVAYTGWLVDGTAIDSASATDPFRVTIGEDFMVDGFMEGIEGIRMGEERLLVLKPELGYGRESVPDVPRDSWLVYRVRRIPQN